MSSTGSHGGRAAQRSRRASGGERASAGAATAILISAAILGFTGGAIAGNATGSGGDDQSPTSLASSPGSGSGTEGGTSPSDGETTPSQDGTSEVTIALSSPVDGGTVAPNERIDITGQLDPPIDGVTLTVERSLDGGDFSTFNPDDPVTPETRDDGSFSTYVLTGRKGVNEWRVVGTVNGQQVESDTISVTVG